MIDRNLAERKPNNEAVKLFFKKIPDFCFFKISVDNEKNRREKERMQSSKEEEYLLPLSWNKKKKYKGRLVYGLTAYKGSDYGRVHDWTYHGESILHELRSGQCPLCCKKYTQKDFYQEKTDFETLCECGKHWIAIGRDYISKVIKIEIFEIVKKLGGEKGNCM